jgi:predicted SprT family Zn-dependent metalloprotease
MQTPRILEVPTPKLIEPEFLLDVFSHQEFSEVRTVVDLSDESELLRFSELGFGLGRQFSKGKNRFQRLKLSRLEYIEQLAIAKLQELLPGGSWRFEFDSAKQRAGLCNYTDKTISISKYFVQIHSVEECVQVVLHEAAHALAGKDSGHGPNWKQVAKSIGYRGEKFTGKEIAEQTARWVGECRNGHRHYRFKAPRVQLACGHCGKGFNPRYLISWTDRAA